MPRTCPACRSRIGSDSWFCPKCGKALLDDRKARGRPKGWWGRHGRALAMVLVLMVMGSVIVGIAWAYTGLNSSDPLALVSGTGDVPSSTTPTTIAHTPTSTVSTTTATTVPPASTTTQSTESTTTTSLVAARLVRVVDGDTIVVKLESGKQERVALIGIDAPEAKRKGSKESGAYLKELLDSGPIGLSFGEDTRDKYKRLLAYVYAGSLFANREMVAKGMAKAKPSGNNREYEDELAEAQESAKKTFQGMWATTTTGR